MTIYVRLNHALSAMGRFVATLIIAGLPTVAAAASADVSPRIKIDFIHPEAFTDARHSEIASAAQQNFLLEALAQHIVRRVERRLPAATALAVTVMNIDMAGRFEPWRNARFQEVRTITDVYPPKLDLEFRLTDNDGKLIREGRRELRDLSFLSKIHQGRDDLLKHEKALLDDWIEREFPSVRRF